MFFLVSFLYNLIKIKKMTKENLLLYYNPRCSKCRIAKGFLEKNNIRFKIINYLDSKMSKDKIKEILTIGDLKVKDIMRINEEEYKQNVRGKDLSEEELITMICEHPKLLQRPIITNSKKALITRDEESLEKVKTW